LGSSSKQANYQQINRFTPICCNSFSDEFNIETDDAESEGKCNIVISLMQDLAQKSRRIKPKSLQIGFAIYKVNPKVFKLALLFTR
jgi:hypothetical protein